MTNVWKDISEDFVNNAILIIKDKMVFILLIHRTNAGNVKSKKKLF
jgi:hypothetical protein